jgi:hypothetical protein
MFDSMCVDKSITSLLQLGKSVTSIGITLSQLGVLDALILFSTLLRRTLCSLITFVVHCFELPVPSNKRKTTDMKTPMEVKGNEKRCKTNVISERSVRLRKVNNI